MKVSELIETLQARLKKHGDVEIRCTWEGIETFLEKDQIYLAKSGIHRSHECLYIDADNNSYKAEFAVDPTEE